VSAQPTIDELLDQAVRALNRGDRPTADALADQVLEVDCDNADAEKLLAAPSDIISEALACVIGAHHDTGSSTSPPASTSSRIVSVAASTAKCMDGNRGIICAKTVFSSIRANGAPMQ